MAKAVFTTKLSPSYDDVPEERYQFPRTYLRAVERAVGDLVVYYEPRRGSAALSSRGERQAYFAVATVADVRPDRRDDSLFYAAIAPGSFLSFDTPVPFRGPGGTYERALTRDDGGTSKGAFGRAIRTLAEEEFAAIVSAGFREDPWERSGEAGARPPPSRACGARHLPRCAGEEKGRASAPFVLSPSLSLKPQPSVRRAAGSSKSKGRPASRPLRSAAARKAGQGRRAQRSGACLDAPEHGGAPLSREARPSRRLSRG